MRRRQGPVFVAAAAALLGTGCAQAVSATTTAMASKASVPTAAVDASAAGPWGRAIPVPGLASLNKGGNADVLSVSCPSAGNCGAGGYYHNHGMRGFVVSESNGRWHRALKVPGLAVLNNGGPSRVNEVSCVSAGSCAAGGFYRDASGHHQGFVVSRTNGNWRQAIEVPGLAALNKGGDAEVISMSCASAGSCAAAGFYTDGSGHQQGFVMSKSNGRWRQAIEVPGLAVLNKGPYARVLSVSCASAGSCSAGGVYDNASRNQQAFVVSETNGSWGAAQEVAANLSTGADTFVDAVSCGSPGNCSAGGQYGNASVTEAFVVSEVNGTWAAARPVAGTASESGDAEVTSVSCASAGNCAAGGQFDYGGYNAAFLVNEKNGTWGKMMWVPGLNRVSRDRYLNSASCASPATALSVATTTPGTSWPLRRTASGASRPPCPATCPSSRSTQCRAARRADA